MNAPAKVEPDTLASAMARAFSEIEAATKSANNPHFKSKYADLTGVIEAIKPALVANGLFFTQRPVPAQGGIQVETYLHHSNGEELCLGSLFVPANKNDAQGYGSALTYARRYALVTAFGVPVEDDDGNAASKADQGQSQRGAVSSDPQPSNITLVTDEQMVRIQSLVQATNSNVGALCKAARVESLAQISTGQADKVIERLEGKLADMAKAETNSLADEIGDDIPY